MGVADPLAGGPTGISGIGGADRLDPRARRLAGDVDVSREEFPLVVEPVRRHGHVAGFAP